MPAKHWSTDTYSVRERFGTGVILLATAYVAVIYAVFGALKASWELPTAIVGYLLWVGACQATLGRRFSPRAISALAGGLLSVGWTVWMTQGSVRYPAFALALVPTFVIGLFFGYASGAIDASLFLVHDFIRDTLGAKRRESESLRAAMGETPSESPFDD